MLTAYDSHLDHINSLSTFVDPAVERFLTIKLATLCPGCLMNGPAYWNVRLPLLGVAEERLASQAFYRARRHVKKNIDPSAGFDLSDLQAFSDELSEEDYEWLNTMTGYVVTFLSTANPTQQDLALLAQMQHAVNTRAASQTAKYLMKQRNIDERQKKLKRHVRFLPTTFPVEGSTAACSACNLLLGSDTTPSASGDICHTGCEHYFHRSCLYQLIQWGREDEAVRCSVCSNAFPVKGGSKDAHKVDASIYVSPWWITMLRSGSLKFDQSYCQQITRPFAMDVRVET